MTNDDDNPFISAGIECVGMHNTDNGGVTTFHVDYCDEYGSEPGSYPFEALVHDPNEFYEFDWDDSSDQYPFLYLVMRRERFERAVKDLLFGPMFATIKGSYVDDEPRRISYEVKFMFMNETDRMMFATYFGGVEIL